MSRINSRYTAGLLGIALAAAVSLNAFAAEEAKAPAQATPAKSWQTGLHRTDLVRQDLDTAIQKVAFPSGEKMAQAAFVILPVSRRNDQFR